MITEWTANKKMERLLNNALNPSAEDKLKVEIEKLKNLFFPSFKQVKDCVIISEESVDRLERSFDKALEINMDKTGYEASNTETRINSFFENSITKELGIKIALMVLDVWVLQLKKIESQSKFCLIISCDEENVEIRFHKVHSNEKMWLAEAIESYQDEAVGYAIV